MSKSLFSCQFKSGVHATVPEKPAVVTTKDGQQIPLDKLIEQVVPEVRDGESFWNSPTLFNGQLQTVYAAAGNFEHIDHLYYGRRLITWENGSTVSVDYVIDPPKSQEQWDELMKYSPIDNPPPPLPRTRYLAPHEIERLHTADNEGVPLVITLHGLTGGSHEQYVRAAIKQFVSPEYGFECLVINSRGCARTKITTPQLFCGLATDDIRRLVKLIRAQQPNRKIYLVGYSLGAAILANYLGQEGEEVAVDAACVVAAPWDFVQSYYALQSSYIGRTVYSRQMARNLKRLLKNHDTVLGTHPVFVAGQSKKVEYLADFDNVYTAPFFGFDTANDYYRCASPSARLMKVRCPLLILNALDDPVADGISLPFQEVERNPYSYLCATDNGGHLGWFMPYGRRWFPSVIAKFFRGMHDHVDHISADITERQRMFVQDRLVLEY
ncbi:monoacylglycerol lipase [Trichomonascus vanleenenianus]|uniref:monoacylglycerol lipase n=1 Tax=Trichomonascus vanleenenianus TaxID=2268995 RepID=UPI003EC9E270